MFHYMMFELIHWLGFVSTGLAGLSQVMRIMKCKMRDKKLMHFRSMGVLLSAWVADYSSPLGLAGSVRVGSQADQKRQLGGPASPLDACLVVVRSVASLALRERPDVKLVDLVCLGRGEFGGCPSRSVCLGTTLCLWPPSWNTDW